MNGPRVDNKINILPNSIAFQRDNDFKSNVFRERKVDILTKEANSNLFFEMRVNFTFYIIFFCDITEN